MREIIPLGRTWLSRCVGQVGKRGIVMNRSSVMCCISLVVVALVVVPGYAFSEETETVSAAVTTWTLAIYVSGDNSLERYWDDSSLPGLLLLPANSMFRIVAYVDRLSTEGTEVVEISGSSWEVVSDLPEMDFGSGATFEWFLEEVAVNYPSEKLAVVAWDHGYAWRYISDDVTSGSRITMPAFQKAIDDAGVYIDLLAFDACNMAAIEVAYQVSLTGLVGIMVGSEESVPTTGFPYDLMFGPAAADESATPAQMAADMVEGFKAFYEPQTWASTVALSAVDVASIGASRSTLCSWVDAMYTCLPLYANNYKHALKEAYSAWATHYHVDLADFGDVLLADTTVTDNDLRTLTSGVVSVVDTSTIAFWGGRAAEDSRGLTMWWGWAGDWKYSSEAYAEVAFAIDTGWWDFLADYN
jgi:hypothetical protein